MGEPRHIGEILGEYTEELAARSAGTAGTAIISLEARRARIREHAAGTAIAQPSPRYMGGAA